MKQIYYYSAVIANINGPSKDSFTLKNEVDNESKSDKKDKPIITQMARYKNHTQKKKDDIIIEINKGNPLPQYNNYEYQWTAATSQHH